MKPPFGFTGAYESAHQYELQGLAALSPPWRAVRARWSRVHLASAQPFGKPTEDMARQWTGHRSTVEESARSESKRPTDASASDPGTLAPAAGPERPSRLRNREKRK